MENNDQSGRLRRSDPARIIEPLRAGGCLPLRAEPDYTWEQAVRVLRKHGRFILLCAGLLTLGIGILAYLMKDVYQPTARLEIDPVNSGIKTLHEIEDSRATDNQDYLETQVQILQSDALAIGVIRALHLDRNSEFVSKGDIEGIEKLKNSQIGSRPGNPDPFLKEQFALADRTPLESAALGVFQKRLSVNPIRNTRVVEVSYTSHDPQLAQVITNNLVTQFLDQSYRARYSSTMEASEWLGTQLNGLRQKVEESNQAVTDYQKKYSLVESDDHDVPLGQLMGEVNHQLSDAQANRIEAEAYVRMIDLGQSDAIPAVRDDQLYQNVMTHYVEVRAKLAQARAIYGDENSNVKKLQDESNELAAQVEAERTRMVNRVRTSFAAANAREQMMLDAREKLKAQMGDASSHMVAFRMLKNEAMANAQLYNTLQGRLKEAGIYAGLRSSNIRVVDLAPELVKATGPHRQLIIVIGGIVSTMLALALAFVRESLDNTVRTPDDLKDWTGLPSLAVLPTISRGGQGGNGKPLRGAELASLEIARLKPLNILATQTCTAEAEAMRDLRTALLLSNSGAQPRVVLVSSPAAGEGKSTVATRLAGVFAQRGKTCLVEGDLRRPQVSRTLGLNAKTGLSNVLNNAASLDDSLASVPDIPNLSLLASGPLTCNPADLAASEQMQALVIDLRNRFDYVVIDSPPVISFSDARILSSYVDAVVLVARYGRTTRRAIVRCTQLLDDVRAPIIGVVLNDIDPRSADYHYYNYGYSRLLRRDARNDEAVIEPQPAPRPPDPPAVYKKGAHA
jgi:succinoglycan biosynthesis transport protein ExoP